MSILTRLAPIAALAGLSGVVMAQGDNAVDRVAGLVDGVRVVITKHELGILQRAYPLDAIGEALPEDFDCGRYARQRLIANGRDASVDLWGQPYRMDTHEQEVRFWSSGPDRRAHTHDDVSVFLIVG
jgi:hypothetical protein